MNSSDNLTQRLNGVTLVRDTARAFLFNIDGEEIWVPRSVVQDWNPKAMYVKIELWWLNKEGILA